MKKMTIMWLLIFLTVFSCDNPGNTINVLESGVSLKNADHTIVNELWNGEIPEADIQRAKDNLHIAYWHTSHGSQIPTGMTSLVGFADNGNLGDTLYSQDLFSYNKTESNQVLHLQEPLATDLGNADWKSTTSDFLDANPKINVVLWSWCGQVSGITEEDMNTNYLLPMTQLEASYPDVHFIYMTGHLDGTGENGNLHLRNEQIREYCEANGKWLYDFADIESYDPDGNYYLDKAANDECKYDSTGDGTRESNWAIDWQETHTEDTVWYSCSSAHSQPLNANMKAYAAWWLFARIAAQI